MNLLIWESVKVEQRNSNESVQEKMTSNKVMINKGEYFLERINQ